MNPRPQFLWYMAGVTCFVIPQGIQTILFPWLVAVQLAESPERLGIAQMSTQLPGLALILFGGLLADRLDRRRILVVCHLLGAVPAVLLGFALHSGHLSYGLLIIYALAMGTIGAFVQPARDGMLNQVAGGQLQRTVTITMGLTFGAQVIGYVAAGFADSVGALPILLLHSTVMGLGALASLMLAPAPVLAAPGQPRGLGSLFDGIVMVWRSPRMAPALALTMTMSFFYGGSFMVLNPLIVRDVYGGAASEISLSFAAFVGGTVLATGVLVAVGGIRRQGLALMLALVLGGVTLIVAAQGLPFPFYLLMILLWGIGGGVSMSMSRTIMQESAPDEYRARVLSVFSLGNLGGMPLGALTLGFCAAAFGPLPALLVAVAGVWCMVTLVWLRTDLARLEPAAG